MTPLMEVDEESDWSACVPWPRWAGGPLRPWVSRLLGCATTRAIRCDPELENEWFVLPFRAWGEVREITEPAEFQQRFVVVCVKLLNVQRENPPAGRMIVRPEAGRNVMVRRRPERCEFE